MPPTTLLTAEIGSLLVIDMQTRLLAVIPDRPRIVANVLRLAQAARLLAVPALATEQYPRGLGETISELVHIFPVRPSKTTFSAGALLEVLALPGSHVTLAGIEAHVCVAQTALELLEAGRTVQIAVDAVASRHPLDAEVALRRLERAGVVLSTTEAVLFEWAGRSDRAEFKALSALVKSADAPRRTEPDSPSPQTA